MGTGAVATCENRRVIERKPKASGACGESISDVLDADIGEEMTLSIGQAIVFNSFISWPSA